MTTQTLPQTLPKTRRTNIARVASISLVLALLVAGVLAYRSTTSARDASRLVGSQAASAPRSPAVPARWSTGSAYDGSANGAYLTGRSAAHNPNVPISGTGSAYDGSHYGSSVLAPQTAPKVSAIGTGSAYDGGYYSVLPKVSAIGTGSAYDGGYGAAPVAARVPYGAGWDLYDNGWAGGPRTSE